MAKVRKAKYIYKNGYYVPIGEDDEAREAAQTAQDIANSRPTLDQIYPVGSIYLSVDPTSPASLFGGTWERIKDTFLLSAGDTYAAGGIGGEAEHTLSIDEMPRHNHRLRFYYAAGVIPSGWNVVDNVEQKSSWDGGMVEFSGNSQPHNNMPPYLAVYVWKRVEDMA